MSEQVRVYVDGQQRVGERLEDPEVFILAIAKRPVIPSVPLENLVVCGVTSDSFDSQGAATRVDVSGSPDIK